MNIQNVPYIQPPIGHIVKAKLIGLPAFKPIPPATVTVNLVNQSGINVSWLGHKKLPTILYLYIQVVLLL